MFHLIQHYIYIFKKTETFFKHYVCILYTNAFAVADLPRVPANCGPQGLSVVSAPAPVVQRPELAPRLELESPGTVSITRVGSNQSMPESQGGSAHLRSTKSQRIRGATNNLRLRQLELRENHAVVFS